MKKTMKILVALMFVGTTISNAQEQVDSVNLLAKTETFKVWGNCGMCENRIEEAAMGVSGVESADWDKETKMMKITHVENVNIHEVHQAIADVGHDTENHKAKDEVYENLPGCCLYRDGGKTH